MKPHYCPGKSPLKLLIENIVTSLH